MLNDPLAQPKGILFCFCAPSGSGKTTICKELLKIDSSLEFSISTTSRAPRQGEIDGKDYYFVNETEFKERLNSGLFIEFNKYADNYYGTEKRIIETAVSNSKDLLFDIDVHGVESLKKLYPEKVVTIFVFPPSFDLLVDRLKLRKSDHPDKLKTRLAEARTEIGILTQPGFTDYLLINDKLQRSLELAQSIITVERVRFKRFDNNFVNNLLS